jgi:DNA/RNA endonuclease YhcR with UshA esterase domain
MKTFLKIILILFAILLIAALSFYFFVYNKPHVDYLQSEVEIEIHATELFLEYVSNPLAAAKKYNGKVLLVTGTVNQIEQADELMIAVMVLDDGFFGPEGVRFSLLEKQKEKIKIGELISLKGFCTGYTGSDVILEHVSVFEK